MFPAAILSADAQPHLSKVDSVHDSTPVSGQRWLSMKSSLCVVAALQDTEFGIAEIASIWL